jgi:hypothetical protein
VSPATLSFPRVGTHRQCWVMSRKKIKISVKSHFIRIDIKEEIAALGI